MSDLSSNNENLLAAWLNMSSCIRGNRIVKNLSFNETMICSYIYKYQILSHENVTATMLIDYTKLLKSQMNKILTSLEERDIIERRRSDLDKRKIYILLTHNGVKLYHEEHENIVRILSRINETMGEDEVVTLTSLINKATNIINSSINE